MKTMTRDIQITEPDVAMLDDQSDKFGSFKAHQTG